MLKMFIKTEGSEDSVKKFKVERICNDDEVVTSFDEKKGAISFECLLDKIGQTIEVYHDNVLHSVNTIKTVARDIERENAIGTFPLYTLGLE